MKQIDMEASEVLEHIKKHYSKAIDEARWECVSRSGLRDIKGSAFIRIWNLVLEDMLGEQMFNSKSLTDTEFKDELVNKFMSFMHDALVRAKARLSYLT